MAQASTSSRLHASRLVRALSDLAAPDMAGSQKHFARRLGAMIDLSDSIRLSLLLAGLNGLPFKPDVAGPASIKKAFIKQREAIVKSILKACIPGASSTRIRFPAIDESTPASEAMECKPFRAFYAAQQSELDFRIRRLQIDLRRDIAGISPELARLVKLDEILLETTGAQARKHFTKVPALLEQRFAQHLKHYREQVSGTDYQYNLWAAQLKQLRDEIQTLLLAEADTRLLPLMGLLEALDDHTEQKPL